jgi:tRNA-specific 2-thiouridylase
MLRPQAGRRARRCPRARFPHYVVDEADQFEELVIDYFGRISQAAGLQIRVMCNEKPKFEILAKKPRRWSAIV